jgi:hypothetical protein
MTIAIPRPCPGCAQGEEITAETRACHINAAALNDYSNTHKTDNQTKPPPAPEVFAASEGEPTGSQQRGSREEDGTVARGCPLETRDEQELKDRLGQPGLQ